MRNKLLLIYVWLVRSLLFFWPDIPICMRFRGRLYGVFMEKAGCDFQVTHDAIIKDLEHISVGAHCFVGNASVIMGSGSIEIGDEVMIAPHVVIISGNHTAIYGSFRYGAIEKGKVVIEHGSWIASNCTVQRGAILPEGSVLSANSFLNKKYHERNALYGGVPAKFIKYINVNL